MLLQNRCWAHREAAEVAENYRTSSFNAFARRPLRLSGKSPSSHEGERLERGGSPDSSEADIQRRAPTIVKSRSKPNGHLNPDWAG
jgi:hypothetical protein